MRSIPRYLYWRGNSLWSRFPIPGRPARYPLEIYTNGSIADKRAQEKLGEAILAKIGTEIVEGKFFDKKVTKEPYRPKVWRVLARYWYHHLRFKSGPTERSNKSLIRKLLKKFGSKFWDELSKESVESWFQTLISEGYAVNSVNSVRAPLMAAYQHCHSVAKPVRTHVPKPVEGKTLPSNPMEFVTKVPGGKIRQFLLSENVFERNYKWLKAYYPGFSVFYLAIWMLGRRPLELSEYKWEMIQSHIIEGQTVHCFSVPPEIAKTETPDLVPIPERLWQAIFAQGWRTGYVFRNSANGQWKHWFQQIASLRRVYPDCGVFRDGRRGFSSYQVNELGKSRSDVKAMTGHKSDSSFDRYCIGSLKNKLHVTHPDLNKKKEDGDTEKGTKLA